jgi:hypothetical protein
MTDRDLAARIEDELRANGVVGIELRAAIEALPAAVTAPLAPALAFFYLPVPAPAALSDEERQRNARLMLLAFGAQTPSPRWSSGTMDTLVATALAAPGARVGDIIAALIALVGEPGHRLTAEAANLILDVVRAVFVRAAAQFGEPAYLADVTIAVGDRPLTAGQAYLLMQALPEAAHPAYQPAILAALAPTPYRAEAERFFAPA